MKILINGCVVAMLLIAFAFLSSFSAQQTCAISGYVADKQTKENVLGAAVVLFKDSQQISGAVADINGQYCLKNINDGTYRMIVSCLDYKSDTIDNVQVINGVAASVNIQMESLEVLLQSVSVSRNFESNLQFVGLGVSKTNSMSTARLKPGHTKALSVQYGYYSPAPGKDWASAPSYDLGETEKPKSKKTEEGSNTEEYDRIIENEFLRPTEKALSTFSIDVDVASYSMMRRKVEEGQHPPQGSVRLEEMINYFTYNYANPTDGKPFSVATEVGECAWNTNHRIMQIGIQGLRIDKSVLPPANLVFLIDVSGSMSSYDKLPLVKQSLQMLTNELRPQDRIAMVVYAGSSGLVLPSTPCSNKQKILDALDRLEAGGSTAGAAGINQAYEVAKANFIANGNNRVILCTDGDFNVGVSSDAELTTLIEKKREEGVFLSVLGFGMGNYKDSKMEKLADKGNGNYAYIDNLAEAKKNLVTQMGGTLLTIAKDVKIQVEFNPAKVKAYRLIGYENRALADKDFNDDKKDAGEIGAGTSVTALYEIITDENDPAFKDMPKTDKLKYQKTEPATTTTGGDEMATIKIRYKEPKENTSQLLEYAVKNENVSLPQTSENYRFASAVAAFGMLLRDSKFSGNYTYDKVRELAISAKGTDTEGYRAEFIKLVTAAKKLPKAAQP